MQPFPHRYAARVSGGPRASVTVESERLPPIRSAPPAEFGGPGDQWSPETLIVGAVADCFVLTFRAVAAAARFPWTTLTCEADGTLDRIDRVAQFTAFEIRARLDVPAGTSEDEARRLLAKAEQACLISNSLRAKPHLQTTIAVAETALP
jgi:organic hydroperoxide reductase OsmC/OhrA